MNIENLIRVTSLLLQRLAENLGNEVEIDKDYYWNISLEEKYDPYNKPKNITLGQLSDDYNELVNILDSGDEIPYDLIRVARILEALSAENQTAF